MNICFFSGKIITDIKFRFIIGNKYNYSIAMFKLQIDSNTIVTIKAYNEFADYCFQMLKYEDKICIYGKINDTNEVEIQYLKKV